MLRDFISYILKNRIDKTPLIALHTSYMCDSAAPVRRYPSKQHGGSRIAASADLPFPTQPPAGERS